MTDDREHRLQQRAYAIWETEGCPEGRDRAHWEQAERELSAAPALEQGATSAPDAAAPSAESTRKKPRRSAAKAANSAASGRRKKSPEERVDQP